MPLFIDVHNAPGVTAEQAEEAHQKDLQVQGQYNVDYRKYWVDEKKGKIFCLVEAPDAETARRVHREAHGMEPDEQYEVQEG